MLKRVQAGLPEKQFEYIENLSKNKGITISEQVRRIIDEYFEIKGCLNDNKEKK